MYRVMPGAAVRSSHPLLGLNALGTIYTFYKLPQYSCLPKKGGSDTLRRAKSLCDAQRKAGKKYTYTAGKHPAGFTQNTKYKKGSPEYFYQVRFNDVTKEYVNPCDIVDLVTCPDPTPPPPPPLVPPPAAPKPPPPVQADTPVVVMPPPPPVYVPAQPPYVPPQQPTAPPVVVVQPPTPYYPSEQPVEVFEPTRTTPVPIEEEEPEPEQEEDSGNLLLIGGLLAVLLAGGVGYAVFKSRKKKRR